MKFRLTYEGELLASQKRKNGSEHKHELRLHFHSQLKTLWESTKFLGDYRYSPISGHSSATGLDKGQDIALRPIGESEAYWASSDSDKVSLLDSIISQDNNKIDGFQFCPLVREEASLHCTLDVLFLVQKTPVGKVFQSGDLDNRMKTLIDALRRPKSSQEIPENAEKPDGAFFCLMDDDDLVSSFSVESDRLLASSSNNIQHYSHVIITVDIKIHEANYYNLSFV